MTSFSDNLLKWYEGNQRTLPWRTSSPNPYHVWLSEIMLQQTTVKTVIPYFEKFITLWPTLEDLAATDLDEVLVAWQGLGYYSRARNLHKCAQVLASEHKGQFPTQEENLLKLPGIGPYTAAAIASIAFEKPAAAVDGNVIRVLARYFALSDMRPQLDKVVKSQLLGLLPKRRCGDFTQALMELGATVCRPKSPTCLLCPLQGNCQGRDTPDLYPTPKPKKVLPTRYAVAYLVEREDGAILLQRREEKGMLGGMMEVPTTPWLDQPPGANVVEAHAPLEFDSHVDLEGHVHHTFTHFHFHIQVRKARVAYEKGHWVHPNDLESFALPTVMKKVISYGLGR